MAEPPKNGVQKVVFVTESEVELTLPHSMHVHVVNGWPHIEIPMYISEMLKWLTNLEIFHISLYYLFNKLDWNDLQEFVT